MYDGVATQEQVGVLRAKSFTFPFSLMLLRVAAAAVVQLVRARLALCGFRQNIIICDSHIVDVCRLCSERSEITSLLTISVMMVTLSVIMCAVYLPDDDGG